MATLDDLHLPDEPLRAATPARPPAAQVHGRALSTGAGGAKRLVIPLPGEGVAAPPPPSATDRMRAGLQAVMAVQAEQNSREAAVLERPHYVSDDFVEMAGLLDTPSTPPQAYQFEITPDHVYAALKPFAYLSGRAGTGKTTLARQLADDRADTVLCATTGIAAVNLGTASTINSLLRYFDTAGLEKHAASGYLRQRLDQLRRSGLRTILLDEVSMLAASQLTCLVEGIEDLASTTSYDKDLYQWEDETDPTLKLLLVGDFAQLPPVEAPYAFESPKWATAFGRSTLRLEKVWRQEHKAFIDALQAVRMGDALAALPVFKDRFVSATDIRFEGTTIVAKNAAVDAINGRRHAELPGEPIEWPAIRSGEQQPEWVKDIPNQVSLKPGALVMCLMNLSVGIGDGPPEYLYVNGDLGTVIEKDPQGLGIKVQIQRTGVVEVVRPHQKVWEERLNPPRVVADDYVAKPGEVVQRMVNTDSGKSQRVLTRLTKGTVTYLPLRLAYATSVHKSQSLSLDRVQVSIGDWMFTKPSMLYVALSRCRSLEGLRIVGSPQQFLSRCAVDKKVKPWL